MFLRVSILTLTFFVLSFGYSTAEKTLSPPAPPPLGQSEFPEPPIGQSETTPPVGSTGIKADIFGKKGGKIHPFLLFEEKYTDNLYSQDTNKQEEFITTISPGLWVALPGNREKLLEIGLSTTAPGGLNLSRIKPETTRRTQGYLLYAPEFMFFSDHSEHNSTNHKAEGLFQYNFNMGLSIDLIDLYNVNNEVNDNGVYEGIDRYKDNLFNLIMVYDTSEKFRFRFDYSNYYLDFDDNINAYRNRTDNSFSAYVFYKVKPKTSVFVEYEFSDISFDSYSDSDSVENRFYAGVEWDVTAKTMGRIKLGYIDKNFDKSGVQDQDGFSFEIQTRHNFNPKRALQVTGFRRFNESTMMDSSTFLSTGVTAAWLQRFTEKWSGTLALGYRNEEYKGESTFNGFTAERDDDIWSLSPAIRYKFRDWLTFDLGYAFALRDSNFSTFDYNSNTVFFRIDLSI